MESLAAISERLRGAIAAQAWTEAAGLLPEYRLALDTALREGHPHERLSEARALVRWARTMALAGREQAACQIAELDRGAGYRSRPAQGGRWELEA